MKKDFTKVAILINETHKEYHDPESLLYRGKGWNNLYGQWLVYGFEKYIGFFEAAALCETIEKAHKQRRSVYDAALRFFEELK